MPYYRISQANTTSSFTPSVAPSSSTQISAAPAEDKSFQKVEDVLAALEEIYTSQNSPSVAQFCVQAERYDALESAMNNLLFRRAFRVSYNSETQVLFVVLMPGPPHEYTVVLFSLLEVNRMILPGISRVVGAARPNIQLPNGCKQAVWSWSLRSPGQPMSSQKVVLEVGSSETIGALKADAQRWFTLPSMNLVIIVDTNKAEKTVTIQHWRRKTGHAAGPGECQQQWIITGVPITPPYQIPLRDFYSPEPVPAQWTHNGRCRLETLVKPDATAERVLCVGFAEDALHSWWEDVFA